VAEGVENQGRPELPRRRQVELIHGYLFSPPLTATAFRSMRAWSVLQPPAAAG